MFGLNKKLLVFGPMAMLALLILAMLVSSVECDDGLVASPSRMMQENMVDGVAATSVPMNTVLEEDVVPENQDDDNNPEFIIGGTELDQTVWETSRRFLVTLTNTLADGSVFHSCTASLISRRVVLSAAHCFTPGGTTNFKALGTVRLNIYSYDFLDGSVQVQLCPNEGGGGDCPANSAFAVRHPDYAGVDLRNDFALIFLPDIPEVNEGVVAEIVPVTLNSYSSIPEDGQELELCGWGLTGTDQTESPRVPHTVKMNSFPFDQCNIMWLNKLDNSMMCTLGDGTTSVYKGDSGGPAIIVDAAGQNIQVGVASFVANGDPTDYPNVYARVSNGFDWIKNTICQEIPTDAMFCAISSTSKANKTKASKSKPSKLFV